MPEKAMVSMEWGRGATSLVHREYSPAKGGFYCVKSLLPKFQGKADFERQIHREFKILDSLRHPFILSAVSIREIENSIGQKSSQLVSHWIDGWPLHEIYSWAPHLDAKFRQDWGRKFFKQLRMVIHHLEDHSVIHGDLCPENIILGRDGFIRLIDFGSARNLKEPYEAIDIGHPPYTAAQGRFELGGDRYSVGKLLEYWFLDAADRHDEEMIQALVDRRAWPAEDPGQKKVEALPIFPFLDQRDRLDARITKTKISEAQFLPSIMLNFPRLPYGLVLLCVFLLSGTPTASLSVNSFPLSELVIVQDHQTFQLSLPVSRLALRPGVIRLEVLNPQDPGARIIRQVHLEAGKEYKIFEDFQNLDTLKKWTRTSTKM